VDSLAGPKFLEPHGITGYGVEPPRGSGATPRREPKPLKAKCLLHYHNLRSPQICPKIYSFAKQIFVGRLMYIMARAPWISNPRTTNAHRFQPWQSDRFHSEGSSYTVCEMGTV